MRRMARWQSLGRVSTGLALLAGCAFAADPVLFDGVPVETISGVAMTCKSPYPLTRDCSVFSGATRQIPALAKHYRVSGSADGTIVLVMDSRLMPAKVAVDQEAGMVVRDMASTLGASLAKAEAVTAGPRVIGFLLTFDRPVYDSLLEHPGVPMRSVRTAEPVALRDPANGDAACELSMSQVARSGASPASEGAQASSAPQRRYALLLRDSQAVTLLRVGTTMLSNASVRVPLASDLLECAGRAVASVLVPDRGFTRVGEPVLLTWTMPDFGVHPMDGAVSPVATDETRQHEAALLGRLAQMGRDRHADMVIVISDHAGRDALEGTNQALVGYGVYFRALVGTRTVHAFAQLRLGVFDVASSTMRWHDILGSRALDQSRWLEVRAGSAVAAGVVESFLPDLRSALPLKRLPSALCQLNLLPVLARSPRFSFVPDCEVSYPAQ